MICRKFTLPGFPMWSPAAESRGALVMPMGTFESTKDKDWTWVLMAPLADVQKAGVHFDPSVRTTKAIQGDAASGSALQVIVNHASRSQSLSVDRRAGSNLTLSPGLLKPSKALQHVFMCKDSWLTGSLCSELKTPLCRDTHLSWVQASLSLTPKPRRIACI